MNLSHLKKKNTQRLDEGETDGDRVDLPSKAFRFPLVALVHLPQNLVGRAPGISSGLTSESSGLLWFLPLHFPRTSQPRTSQHHLSKPRAPTATSHCRRQSLKSTGDGVNSKQLSTVRIESGRWFKSPHCYGDFLNNANAEVTALNCPFRGFLAYFLLRNGAPSQTPLTRITKHFLVFCI